MTATELDTVMRYFSSLFARWSQAKAPEVLAAYGGRVRHFDQRDVREAIEELAEGSLLFPTVQEFVEACAIVKRRNLPPAEKPKGIAAPKMPPLQAFVASMRDAGEDRPIGPNEARAFRLLAQANLPQGAKVGDMVTAFVRRYLDHGTPVGAQTFGSVSECLAHEGYAVR